MKNSFAIWLIIFGTSFACIGIVLEAKRDYSIHTPIETTSENNEKTDTDEGIIPHPQLMFYGLAVEIENPFFLELIHQVVLPELRPPRTI